jgi:hypothetical protein
LGDVGAAEDAEVGTGAGKTSAGVRQLIAGLSGSRGDEHYREAYTYSEERIGRAQAQHGLEHDPPSRRSAPASRDTRALADALC